MSAALRAELFKQRTTRTAPGLFAAMLGLVVVVVLLHAFGAAALQARGFEVLLDAGDYALLLAGARSPRRCGRRSASAWAPLFATRCRRSSASPHGCCSSSSSGPGPGRHRRHRGPLPGTAGRAISGQNPGVLLTPGVALVVLALYAAAAAMAGSLATSRRDAA